MLYISRKNGERIFIGKDIVITVMETRRGQTNLGIEAPPEIVIDREEVAEAKRRERMAEREFEGT